MNWVEQHILSGSLSSKAAGIMTTSPLISAHHGHCIGDDPIIFAPSSHSITGMIVLFVHSIFWPISTCIVWLPQCTIAAAVLPIHLFSASKYTITTVVRYCRDDALTELLDDDGDETTKGVDGAKAMATGPAAANMSERLAVNFIVFCVLYLSSWVI